MEAYSYGQVCLVLRGRLIILTNYNRASHVGGSDDFNVVFIGAGNIMFGIYIIDFQSRDA